jgi:uncharacterized protein YcbX
MYTADKFRQMLKRSPAHEIARALGVDILIISQSRKEDLPRTSRDALILRCVRSNFVTDGPNPLRFVCGGSGLIMEVGKAGFRSLYFHI